jgi:pimeloyl-ACP methyl ester carboxylesterase
MDVQRTTVSTGIEIASTTAGDPSDPPVLLVMGLGFQLIHWDDEFVDGLVRRGHYVIRYDNRDAGESTHLHDAPRPDLAAAFGGDLSSASYSLMDLADDAAGLLDALGLDSAHVVGMSMGGMIAQELALRHPERVRSLISIMSTTGDPAVGQPSQQAMAMLLRPPADDREQAAEMALAAWRVWKSPAHPRDEQFILDRARRAYDRAFDPVGVARQLLAIWAGGDRTQRLRELRVPTLVLHGDADTLVDVSGGRATAAAVPGAELVVVPGMGHDLPPGVWDLVCDAIADLVEQSDGRAAVA